MILKVLDVQGLEAGKVFQPVGLKNEKNFSPSVDSDS